MATRVTELDRAIAAKIKAAREVAGLTQEQMAGHLQQRYQAYQRLEYGKMPLRVAVLVRVADILSVKIENLVDPGVELEIDPDLVKFRSLLTDMNTSQRGKMYELAVQIKHGGAA